MADANPAPANGLPEDQEGRELEALAARRYRDRQEQEEYHRRRALGFEISSTPLGWKPEDGWPEYASWDACQRNFLALALPGDVVLPYSGSHRKFHWIGNTSIDGEDMFHAWAF